MITRKAINSHVNSKGNRNEDMGLQAAANMIGCDRRTAYKAARAGRLEVTRKADASGQPKIFVSKRSVFKAMRAFAAK